MNNIRNGSPRHLGVSISRLEKQEASIFGTVLLVHSYLLSERVGAVCEQHGSGREHGPWTVERAAGGQEE